MAESNYNNPFNFRQKIEFLFLYYCEYSLDKGTTFVKHINFFKLLKDANVLGNEASQITEKEVNLILSRELDNPTIKSIDFQSFLNILVKIGISIYPPSTGSQNNFRESIE